MKTLRLTTIGRRTGATHTVTLYALDDGERWVVVASNGGKESNPDWYLNLSANGNVQLALGKGEPTPAFARDATDDERQDLWPRLVEMFDHYARFQRKAPRQLPVVILEPVAIDQAPKSSKRSLIPKLGGAAVGSAMAGLDAAVFKTQPPQIEVVEHHRHDGPVVTEDGIVITLPERETR